MPMVAISSSIPPKGGWEGSRFLRDSFFVPPAPPIFLLDVRFAWIAYPAFGFHARVFRPLNEA